MQREVDLSELLDPAGMFCPLVVTLCEFSFGDLSFWLPLMRHATMICNFVLFLQSSL